MIIFDLDGTLANCEHRRHFVDPKYNKDYREYAFACEGRSGFDAVGYDFRFVHNKTMEKFNPDWESFYEACDKDTPIGPVVEIFESLQFENYLRLGKELQIWSGRSESVREKTIEWLDINVYGSPSCKLKMRPIGDSTPDDMLKERWLDESISDGKTIDFVFDDRPKVVRMWRRRGIFVFNCNQT